jgi:small subunit ribosomal protein S2
MSMLDGIDKLILTSGIRIGTDVKNKHMERFIARSNEGVYLLDMSKTVERLDVASSFIVRALPNVAVCTSKEQATVAVKKFCELTGCRAIIGRFMPGTFTNPYLSTYIEPQVVLVSDPQTDMQAIVEATNAGIPVIAMVNTDNSLSNVDIAIPTNNRGRRAVAATYWLLALYVLMKRELVKERTHDTFIYNGNIYRIDDFEAKIVEQ